jgi:sigma-B regulation protein RsbU (phosphoserine phosphatase)
VQAGDFSHRIAVHGDDQIGELSGSFNRMTENIERLLVVAKERERIQADLEIAREVQNELLPRVAPAPPHLRLLAVCKPARMVSGDCYDYQCLPDGKLALAIGDVAGKGISAALLMATLQSTLRTHLRGGGVITPASLVSKINVHLHAHTSAAKYATFCFAQYEDDTGMLTYTNAGHLPPLLLRRGEVTQLDVNGMVVGAFPAVPYHESRLQMESGDLLVFYTDGVTEPENEYSEMFGERRLIDVLKRHAHLDAERIAAAVVESVELFTGSPELQDDLTLLLAKRL